MPSVLTARRWRVVRWGVLVAMVVGLSLAWILGPPEQCRDAATDTQVWRVCEPVSLASPPVLVLLLLAALLLVPDFAEVQLGGVLGLRRELADTQTRMAVVQRDVAQLNLLTARIAADAVAHSGSFAEAESHLHLHLERQAATAAALEAARAAAPVLAGRRSPGVYASAAVHAGMLGLAGFFPTWCGPVQAVGLTADGDALELTHDFFGVHAREVDRVRALLTEPGSGVLVDIDEVAWVAASRARDDDGEVVGALGVVLTAPRPSAEGGDLSTDQVDELAAAVETAARTYARLLVDLLGERPTVVVRPAGPGNGPPAAAGVLDKRGGA